MKPFGYLKRKWRSCFRRTEQSSDVISIIYSRRGELEESLVCAKFAHTKDYGRREGFTQRTETTLYNLDVIISVGYRVKSKRGTQFRIWANKILKQYLLQGYAINERIASQKFDELSQLVKVLGRTIQNQEKLTEDSRSLLNVVVDYTYALDTLDRYDYQELTIEKTTLRAAFHATYENAMEVICQLHEKFGGSPLFGNEKDDSFKSSIGQIYQTFGGEDLYPSVEEKAAMLLSLLPSSFTTSEAVGIGKRIGLSESTVKRFLREGAREFIRKEAHGHYCKI